MNLSALQLLQPIDPQRGAIRVIAGRVGRLALLYAAIAATGAILGFVASWLTWQNLAVAAPGLLLGLGAIHSATAFVDVLLLLVQHMREETRAFRRIVADLRAESRAIMRELGTHHFNPDDTQPFRAPESILRRNFLKYASLMGVIAPLSVLLWHVSAVVFWSGLSGVAFGIVIIVVDRVVLHIHIDGLDVRRNRRGTDVTTPC